MNNDEQIRKALSAHDLWKSRLKKAIESGVSVFDPKKIRDDKTCEFGKWLYNDISSEFKKLPVYASIIKNHSDFHIEAAKILQIVADGKKEKAEKEMPPAGKFSEISAALAALIDKMKSSIK